ncbi:MAG: peptidylprolyl isomerase [Planctomycetota bacterium]
MDRGGNDLRRRLIPLFILAHVLFLAPACGGEADAEAAKAAAAIDPALLAPPAEDPVAPDQYRVRVEVEGLGFFILNIRREWAPRAADRFHAMVAGGLLDGAPFFRVVPGFVVQFGRSIHPEVNAAWLTRNLPDETEAKPQTNTKGRIAFAKGAEPDSRCLDVFINLGDNGGGGGPNRANLDAEGFLPFGEVIEGMPTIEAIYCGYGEMASVRRDGGGIDTTRLTTEGDAYLELNFPMVDVIATATIQ